MLPPFPFLLRNHVLCLSVFLWLLIVQSAGHLAPLARPTDNQNRSHDYRSVQVRSLTAGFGGFCGSISWVVSIFDYAGVIFDGDSPGRLPRLFYITTQLDTAWSYPGLVAAWSLSQIPGVPAAEVVEFLDEGAKQFPSEWKFRLTWAQYVIDASDIDSAKARDSAAAILLPLASSPSSKVPQYARNLAFTLMHKNGKPEEAMSLLLQTYEQVPDPMVRYQFRGKIGDLLWRNNVSFGRDSSDFLGGVGALLESKDPAEPRMARQLLTDLVDSTRRERALDAAHQLARQYAAFSRK